MSSPEKKAKWHLQRLNCVKRVHFGLGLLFLQENYFHVIGDTIAGWPVGVHQVQCALLYSKKIGKSISEDGRILERELSLALLDERLDSNCHSVGGLEFGPRTRTRSSDETQDRDRYNVECMATLW